jgi:acyl-CoA thioester hydrolase
MKATTPPIAAFGWPVRVYWEDTDAGGIVFYANYLKFFERARTEWLRERGVEQRRLREETGGMFVVSEAQLRYHRSAKLDDELTVTAQPIEIGRASMTIQQQALLKNGNDTTLLCEATVRIGWIKADSHQLTRIPSTLLDALR